MAQSRPTRRNEYECNSACLEYNGIKRSHSGPKINKALESVGYASLSLISPKVDKAREERLDKKVMHMLVTTRHQCESVMLKHERCH
jgi:hypothetical protein